MRGWAIVAGLVLVLSSTTQANRALLKDGDSDDYRFSTSQVGYKDWAGRCKEPELQWLRAYAEFHAGARKSKDAKYLVYSCSVNQHCGGLGDRVRGMLYMLRLAAATKRVLLISHMHPSKLEEVLQPAGPINWSMEEAELTEAISSGTWPELPIDPKQSLHPPTAKPEGAYAAWSKSDAKWLLATTNAHPASDIPGVTDSAPGNNTHCLHCMFTLLFRPTAEVNKALEVQYNRSRISPAKPYAAVHLRLLATSSAAGKPEVLKDGFERVLAGIKCAQELCLANTIPLQKQGGNPILVVTDHVYLRHFIIGNVLGLHVTTLAHHDDSSEKSQDLHHQDFINTVAELRLMAAARCLITSPHGISGVALWWGGATECTTDLQQCKDEHWKLRAPPPPPGTAAAPTDTKKSTGA